MRRARPDDAEAIADVFIPARAQMTYLPQLHTDADTRAYIRDVVMRELEVWVTEPVVAFAALSDDMLDHLYVHPNAQGHGLGTQLLDTARRRRPDGFRLWVFQKNAGARRFYERHGCRLVRLTDGRDNVEREPDALYEWRP